MSAECLIDMTNRALITGLSGFTGQYMAAALKAQGYQVFDLESVAAGGATKLVDLRDAQAVSAAVAEIRPEIVVHLAAVAFVAHGDASEIYSTNIVGTRNLLSALASADCKVQKVLLASSANIYGNGETTQLDEQAPARPENDYAVSKYAMELMSRQWLKKLPIVIARPFNYTGVGQSKSFLLPKIVDHFARGESGIQLGNIDVYRDFSDVRVVVDCYQRLLAKGEPGRAYNICTGEVHSLQDILNILATIAGYEIKITVNPDFVRANEVKRLSGSNLLLTKTIGAPLQIPLEETLRWMYHQQIS